MLMWTRVQADTCQGALLRLSAGQAEGVQVWCLLVKYLADKSENYFRSVPVTKCRKVPDRECQIGKKQVCEDKPETECDDIHRKVPHTLKRKKPVEVCNSESDSENKYVIEV